MVIRIGFVAQRFEVGLRMHLFISFLSPCTPRSLFPLTYGVRGRSFAPTDPVRLTFSLPGMQVLVEAASALANKDRKPMNVFTLHTQRHTNRGEEAGENSSDIPASHALPLSRCATNMQAQDAKTKCIARWSSSGRRFFCFCSF